MKSEDRALANEQAATSSNKIFMALEFIGHHVHRFFSYLGELAKLSYNFFQELLTLPFGFRDIKEQCEQIGLMSLPIAVTTQLFVGMVFAFQFGVTLKTMGAVPYIGKVTALSVVRELGPVFTSIVVGGRVGAGMAAEIGSMLVSEQIDAIRAIGASPYKKLLVPRVVAATLMLPIVSLMAGVVAILGSMLIAFAEFDVSPIAFYNSALSTVTIHDFVTGYLKPYFFGFGIAIIGCYHGFNCTSGTVGVGIATTRAVVNVSLMIVFADFFLTRIFQLFKFL